MSWQEVKRMFAVLFYRFSQALAVAWIQWRRVHQAYAMYRHFKARGDLDDLQL